MRKVMLLAAMLAMVLAAAAPVFAQTVAAEGGDDAVATNVQYVDCSQVVDIVGGQYGDSEAAADDESVAAAANTFGISVNQVNACLGGEITTVVGSVDAGNGGGGSASASASASAAAGSSAVAADSGDTAAAAAAELPETGGASLLALGAGALLVAGGLVARRIVR